MERIRQGRLRVEMDLLFTGFFDSIDGPDEVFVLLFSKFISRLPKTWAARPLGLFSEGVTMDRVATSGMLVKPLCVDASVY